MKAGHHKLIGKGGIHCDCCRRHWTKKETRTKVNRANRRKDKMGLRDDFF